jgi:hypothetical protein
MRIQGNDDSYFTIDFVGYQFPEETGYWDGNWLTVRVSVKHSGGAWQATDPSLLTFEAIKLATWLETLADTGTASRLAFLEPNLSFESVSLSGGTGIRIYFELESRPAWAQSVPWGEFWLDFACSEQDLRDAVSALRGQLRPFPVRGTPDAHC